MSPAAASLLQQADQALRTGRADEAERLTRAVLRSEPAHPLANKLLGQARLVQGDPRQAVDPLRRAARRLQDGEAETLLARALHLTGDIAGAVDELRRAVTREPPFPLAFLELAERLSERGEGDAAIQVLEAGLGRVPNAGILAVALGWLRLSRRELAEARRLFEGVRNAAPGRYDALAGLADTLSAQGEFAAAAALYREALARQPDDASASLALGKCLLELGQRDAGEAAIRGAAGAGPEAAWHALHALAATPHGRVFMRLSDARAFLEGR